MKGIFNMLLAYFNRDDAFGAQGFAIDLVSGQLENVIIPRLP